MDVDIYFREIKEVFEKIKFYFMYDNFQVCLVILFIEF